MAQFTPKHNQNFTARHQMEDDGTPKPLSTAIMQELANLKEKFKNEDDEDIKGKASTASVIPLGRTVLRPYDLLLLYIIQRLLISTWTRPPCCRSAKYSTTRAL